MFIRIAYVSVVFAPNATFRNPRYVLGLTVEGKDRVFVLDDKALHVFKLDGRPVVPMFEGEADRFRGQIRGQVKRAFRTNFF